MAFRYIKHTALVATLLRFTAAQQPNVVPEDLRSTFSKGTEVQVSYTNEANNGFRDGTLFEKDAVSKEPTFALGDSSGISTSTLYTIIMLDTTCPNKRIVHYARSNFKNSGGVKIASNAAAIAEYKAPGAFGETGDNRQYSFLLYVNPQRKQIDTLKLPAEGEAFDAKKFQGDNGLQDPEAGLGMVVKLGGTADCGGDAPADVPDALPTPQPAASSRVVASASAKPATSAAVQPQTSAAAASSQRASSAANSAPTPSSAPGNGSTPADGAANAPVSSGIAVASSVLQSVGGIATQTVVLSSGTPGGAGGVGAGGVGAGAGVNASATASAPAQQTANAASVVGTEGLKLLAPLVAVAGLVMW